MIVRHILFPSDLSAASREAFAHARLLADRFGAQLTLYHAVDVPWAAYESAGVGHDPEIRARFAAEARAELDRLVGPPSGCEVLVDSNVVAPSLLVDVALLALLRERRPDLVVMATHARTGLSRAFMGSVAEQVVHHSGRPVLCVRPRGYTPRPYRRLLVPTDLSDASREAFPWAMLLARAFEAELMVVHVPLRPTMAALSGLAPEPPLPSAEEVRRFVGGHLGGIPFGVRVPAPARAWSAITELAEEWPADLVVMASRGHDSLGDRLLGSTTDRVLRHCSVPVLVT